MGLWMGLHFPSTDNILILDSSDLQELLTAKTCSALRTVVGWKSPIYLKICFCLFPAAAEWGTRHVMRRQIDVWLGFCLRCSGFIGNLKNIGLNRKRSVSRLLKFQCRKTLFLWANLHLSYKVLYISCCEPSINKSERICYFIFFRSN